MRQDSKELIQDNDINPDTGVVNTKPSKLPKLSLGSGSSRRIDNAARSFTPAVSGGGIGIDLSDYTPYTGPVNAFTQDIDARRAGSQSGLELFGKGLGNFLTTGLGEIAKMPGYLMGIGDAMMQGEFDVEKAVDNAWINTINEFQEEIRDNNLQIYKPEEAQESLMGALGSPEFWASDFADGLGFFASMLVPGAGLSKLGTGSKVMKMLGAGTANSNRLSKVLGSANGAAKIDLGVTTTINTLFEAAAEAGSFRNNLKDQYNSFRQEDGTYKLPNNEILTGEQVDAIIGESTANVYNSNLALLVLPNLVVNNAMFGKLHNKNWFKKYATKARELEPAKTRYGKIRNALKSKTESVTGRAALSAIEENLSRKITTGQMIKNSLGKLAGGAASEGLVEEGGQMAVENYFTDQALEGDTDFSLEGIADAYLKTLASAEGQQGMFIGALLGGGTQAATINRQEARERKRKLGITKAIKEGINNVENASSIWKTENGKTSLDVNALTEQIETNSYLAYNYNILMKAAEENDTDTARVAWDNIFVTFAKNYITEEGGLEFMKEHFDSLADTFLQGVNSFVESNEETKTPEQVKKDIEQTKQNLFKRAENLRATYEDIVTVGAGKFFNLQNIEVKEEYREAFENNLAEKTLRAANTIYSIKEQLDEVNQEIAQQSNAGTLTSTKLVEEYLEPRKNHLEKILETETQKYNELFEKDKQREEFKKFQKYIEDKEQAEKESEEKEKDYKERFRPNHKQALNDKGYRSKEKPDSGTTARAGTYFRSSNGDLYRLSQTKDGRKNEIESRYDLVNVITGERIPYNDYVGMEMGFENPDRVLSVKEAKQQEKERRRNPKAFISEDLVGPQEEGTEASDPAVGGVEWEDGAKKSNPFSTMTSFYKGANGVRWAEYFSNNNINIDNTKILFVSYDDLLTLEGAIYPKEIAEEYRGEGNLFAVPLVNGKVLLNSKNELIYAGLPFVETLQDNDSILWDDYVENFMVDIDRDFQLEPITTDNGFEYEGETFSSNNEFYAYIQNEVLADYKRFRDSIKSGQVVKATDISKGIPQYDGNIKNLSDVIPAKDIFSVEVEKNHVPEQNIIAGSVYVVLKDADGNPGKKIKVGQNRISEKENSTQIIDSVIQMLILGDELDNIYDDIPTSNNSTTKLYSSTKGEGAISKLIRVGKGKVLRPYDIYIEGRKGNRVIIYKDKEGNVSNLPIKDLKDSKSESSKVLKQIIADKFLNVDLKTLQNNNNEFWLPIGVKNGVIQVQKFKSYKEYLVGNHLSTTLSASNTFINQYISFDKDTLSDSEILGKPSDNEPTGSSDIVTDEIWEEFVNTEDVPENILKKIAEKIADNIPLTDREEAIRQAYPNRINIKLKIIQSKKKPIIVPPPPKKDGKGKPDPINTEDSKFESGKTYTIFADDLEFDINVDKESGVVDFSTPNSNAEIKSIVKSMNSFFTDDINDIKENLEAVKGFSKVVVQVKSPDSNNGDKKDSKENENCNGGKGSGDGLGGRNPMDF